MIMCWKKIQYSIKQLYIVLYNIKDSSISLPLISFIVHLPVNKKEIVLAKCLIPGWSGITHQNNNEACKQDQGAEHETDLAGEKEDLFL